MSVCAECGQPTVPIKFRVGPVDRTPVSICRRCRGKRAGAVNRAKAAKHGSAVFNGRSADARRDAL